MTSRNSSAGFTSCFSKKVKGRRGEFELMFHPSGHVVEATAVEIHQGMRKTGDVLFEDLRTLKSAYFPIGHFDTLIIETTRHDGARLWQ